MKGEYPRQKIWRATPNGKAYLKREVNKRRIKGLAFLRGIKAQSGCLDCGVKDVRVLTFHHLDPSTKRLELARRPIYSLVTLTKEVSKCVVLCFNCHHIRHSTVTTGRIDGSGNREVGKEQ